MSTASGGGGNGKAATLIVKKRRKGGHDGHHGGAWKVAYADFVTAMMAFFLLLWLLNVTTDEQRMGIADYFDPSSVSRSYSGSGGVLGGLTVSSPGQLSSPNARFSLQRHLPGRPEAVEGSTTLDAGTSLDPTEEANDLGRYAGRPDEFSGMGPAEGRSGPGTERQAGPVSAEQLAAARAAEEQRQFEAAAEMLRQAIQSVPELRELAQSLLIEQTPEGMRIQIVDQERVSMFPLGSAQMHERTRQLHSLVARAVARLPNRLSISGHTDATPYLNDAQYDNWDLSAARANASRRALVAAGVDPNRISTVVGLADTEPRVPENPRDPRNRRISIVLLREAPAPQPQPQPQPQRGPAAPAALSPPPGAAASQ